MCLRRARFLMQQVHARRGSRGPARRIELCPSEVSGMPSSAPLPSDFFNPQGEHPRPRRTTPPPPPAPSSCVRAACLGRRAFVRRRSLTINSSFSSTAPASTQQTCSQTSTLRIQCQRRRGPQWQCDDASSSAAAAGAAGAAGATGAEPPAPPSP